MSAFLLPLLVNLSILHIVFIHEVYCFGPLAMPSRPNSLILTRPKRLAASMVLRMNPSDTTANYFIGIDLGTSGARISLIEPNSDADTTASRSQSPQPIATSGYQEIYSHAIGWNSEFFPIPNPNDTGDDSSAPFLVGSYDEPEAWYDAVQYLFDGMALKLPRSKMKHVRAICISGTSSSCVLVQTLPSEKGTGLQPTRGPKARMYNYVVQICTKTMQFLQQSVPERHTAQSVTSTLAKLISWHFEQPLDSNERLCHQADYIIRQWCIPNDTDGICSDWHNCLKLGYDVRARQWPEWLRQGLSNVGISADQVLPQSVVSPGAPLGVVRPELAEKYGFSRNAVLVGGTTDSNAAFFAATQGMCEPGVAVTSLGSTVAIKQLSTTYIEDSARGVYSHRFPSSFALDATPDDALWLVGGASNVGCAILRKLNFTNDELDRLSSEFDPNVDSPYAYYPLPSVGERFPIADRDKQPVLHPVPPTRKEYLYGILQGIGDVERDGYMVLGTLGAQPSLPKQIWTCGGGSRNSMWNRMRERRLREAFANVTESSTSTDSLVTVDRANNVEASYGAAILAATSFRIPSTSLLER